MMLLFLVFCSLLSSARAQVPYTVKQEDSLWKLASVYYRDPFQWPKIAKANLASVKDPHWIYPGQQIVIPELSNEKSVPKPEVVSVVPKEELPPPVVAPAAKDIAIHQPDLESVSVAEPPGLAGQSPSMKRFKEPRDWKADGKILEKAFGQVSETDKYQLVAPLGATIDVRLNKGVAASEGDRLSIYRISSPHDGDKDLRGRYLLEVASAEVIKKLSATRYRVKILTSDDPVEPGDLIKKDWK